MLAVAVYLALRWLEIPETLDRGIEIALLIVVWLQIALWGTTAVRHLIESGGAGQAAGPAGAAGLNILRVVAVAAVWSVAFLMLLANLGVEIMPLVAGLGIGGIAIALAVQNVLGDLLASLSIALDKPFKVGDFLVVSEEKGTVEYIGIKSTRLRSISGEQIIVSNGEVLKNFATVGNAGWSNVGWTDERTFPRWISSLPATVLIRRVYVTSRARGDPPRSVFLPLAASALRTADDFEPCGSVASVIRTTG